MDKGKSIMIEEERTGVTKKNCQRLQSEESMVTTTEFYGVGLPPMHGETQNRERGRFLLGLNQGETIGNEKLKKKNGALERMRNRMKKRKRRTKTSSKIRLNQIVRTTTMDVSDNKIVSTPPLVTPAAVVAAIVTETVANCSSSSNININTNNNPKELLNSKDSREKDSGEKEDSGDNGFILNSDSESEDGGGFIVEENQDSTLKTVSSILPSGRVPSSSTPPSKLASLASSSEDEWVDSNSDSEEVTLSVALHTCVGREATGDDG